MPRLSDEPHGTHRCGKKWHRKRAKSSSGATQALNASAVAPRRHLVHQRSLCSFQRRSERVALSGSDRSSLR